MSKEVEDWQADPFKYQRFYLKSTVSYDGIQHPMKRAPSARYVSPVIARLRRAGRKVMASEAGKDFIR